MDDATWIDLIAADQCPPGKRRRLSIEDRDLVVFHLQAPDRFVVIGNACPHAGGSLAEGELEGGKIACPWHNWAFDLDTGACRDVMDVHLDRYECRVLNGSVQVKLHPQVERPDLMT